MSLIWEQLDLSIDRRAYEQAKAELGKDAILSHIAARAQEIKTQIVNAATIRRGELQRVYEMALERR